MPPSPKGRCRSTSPTPTAPGSVAATRTPTASSANTSPKASKSHPTRNISRWWLATSTTDPVRSTTGRSPPRYSPNSSSQMLRPPEFAGSSKSADDFGKVLHRRLGDGDVTDPEFSTYSLQISHQLARG